MGTRHHTMPTAMKPAPTELAAIPGRTRNEQILVCLDASQEGVWKIQLHEQRWAEGIGWYDQKVIELEPAQWRRLQQLVASPALARRVESDVPPATVPFPHRRPTPRSQSFSQPLADGA